MLTSYESRLTPIHINSGELTNAFPMSLISCLKWGTSAFRMNDRLYWMMSLLEFHLAILKEERYAITLIVFHSVVGVRNLVFTSSKICIAFQLNDIVLFSFREGLKLKIMKTVCWSCSVLQSSDCG